MNVQVVTNPDGRLLWLSPALPGRAHDLTAACTHRIIRICERQVVPILADLAYQGGGPWVTTGIKRRPLQELTPTEKTVNRALAAARAPVERGVARLKSWRIFRRSRCSPNCMTSSMKGRGRSSAVLIRVFPTARWDEGVLGREDGLFPFPGMCCGPARGRAVVGVCSSPV